MKTTYLFTLLGLSFISSVITTQANPLDRGTSLDVVVANTVELNGSDSTPVMFRVVSRGPLSSAVLEGRFRPNTNAWVLTEFQKFVLPSGLQVPLGKVKGSDVYGSQSVEVLQSDRSEWAGYIGKSRIPAGTHFNMMLTTNLEVPAFTQASLAMAR